MALQRLRCEWGGAGIDGPGLTTFYAQDDSTVGISGAAAGFFSAVAGRISSSVQVYVPNGGDVIDETNGQLVGTWGVGTGTTIDGTGAGAYARGVGARVVWETDAVRAGRRVRGSTFVVPLISGAYDTQGNLSDATLLAFNNGIDSFMAAILARARVWSRPRPGLAGAGVVVTGGRIPDKVSWLRSRRV